MFWTMEKLQARNHQLDELRYRDSLTITKLRMMFEEEAKIGQRKPPAEGVWQELSLGDRCRVTIYMRG
jgi:hypothetical protein